MNLHCLIVYAEYLYARIKEWFSLTTIEVIVKTSPQTLGGCSF